MAQDEIALQLMRLYRALRSAYDERSKAAIRGQIDQLLSQVQAAARSIQPAAGNDNEERSSLHG
jgi:hypothetical protein